MSLSHARTLFTMSRTMEFFSEAELAKELSTPRHQWGKAILKELVDNALDACETAGIAPHITVTEDDRARTLTVQDNGPGLPLAVLEKSLDYTVRVSDKAYYVSPSRGQQGHALKCLWPLPFVVGGQRAPGQVDVSMHGMRYEVRVSVDAIAHFPQLTVTPIPAPEVKSGMAVTIHWPGIVAMGDTALRRLFAFLRRTTCSSAMPCSIRTRRLSMRGQARW
jgi:DNA topoisomerase VI subunit B